MKNLVGYIFGFGLCAFFQSLTWSEIAKQDGSGNVLANTLFLLGMVCSGILIIAQTYKIALNLINSNK